MKGGGLVTHKNTHISNGNNLLLATYDGVDDNNSSELFRNSDIRAPRYIHSLYESPYYSLQRGEGGEEENVKKESGDNLKLAPPSKRIDTIHQNETLYINILSDRIIGSLMYEVLKSNVMYTNKTKEILLSNNRSISSLTQKVARKLTLLNMKQEKEYEQFNTKKGKLSMDKTMVVNRTSNAGKKSVSGKMN